ncbi:MAG: hypothetical protein HYZ29_23345 [Myxococcales bacterium]|nr:hypothetical protein [Myxococcales bacterium]
MKISKEKWAAMKSRARGAGRRFAGGAKGSAIEGGIGVVGYFAHRTASEKIGFVGSKWWAGPAAMAVLGHVMKKKAKTANIGTALLGAAGYAGAMGYSLTKAGETTKGLQSPGEVGALQSGYGYLPDTGPTDSAPGTSAYDEVTGYEDEEDISSAMGL